MARRDKTPAPTPPARGSTAPAPAPKAKRGAQIRAAYTMAREANPYLPLILIGTFVGILAVCVLLGILLDHRVLLTIGGVLIASVVTMYVFGKRAEKSVYAQIDGQLGAAAGVLENMRGRWTITPVVAYTKAQDVVHRAVGRCGIVLIGEGSPARLMALFAQERKKLQRMAPDVPVSEYVVGNEPGQLPLRKMQRTLMRLPRRVPAAQVAEVDRRLRALGPATPPIPKGPMPRGMRMPRGGAR